MNPTLVGATELCTNRHAFGATTSQTRANLRDIVAPEGGGTTNPTQGGGVRAAAGSASISGVR
jgi:hypothetical protein